MSRTRLPIGVLILIGLFAASPLLQALALATGATFLNFGRASWYDALVHFAVAPWVAYLLASGHRRARFTLYLFASLTIVRGLRLDSLPLVLGGLLAIAYVQLPAVSAIYPRVDPAAMRDRWRSGKKQ